MSIYCTVFDLGLDHTARCKRVRKIRNKVYEQDDSKPCTCGSSPIVYQGSHVLPSKKDLRDGSIDLGAIPPHITRNGKDDGPENGNWHPWLRLSVNDSTVILTWEQTKKLRDALSDWMRRS